MKYQKLSLIILLIIFYPIFVIYFSLPLLFIILIPFWVRKNTTFIISVFVSLYVGLVYSIGFRIWDYPVENISFYLGLFFSFIISEHYYKLISDYEKKTFSLLSLSQQTSREKKEILSKFGHEIRSPLSKIMGFSELIILDMEKGRVVEIEDLQRIFQACQEISTTMKGIMSYSQMELSYFKFSEGKNSIQYIIEKVLESSQSILDLKKIKIIFHEKNKSIKNDYTGDAKILARVLSGVLTFVGQIILSQSVSVGILETEHTQTIIFYLDNIKFKQEEIKNLLNPFQAPNTQETLFDMGIGLYYCKRLLEALHGELDLESFDAGTKLIINLRKYMS